MVTGISDWVSPSNSDLMTLEWIDFTTFFFLGSGADNISPGLSMTVSFFSSLWASKDPYNFYLSVLEGIGKTSSFSFAFSEIDLAVVIDAGFIIG